MAATCAKCDAEEKGLCIHEKTVLISIILVTGLSWIHWLIL